MSRHYCKFDESGRLLESHIADGMPYHSEDLIEVGCIEISEEDFSFYIQDGGDLYIRGKSGKPEARILSLPEQKERWLFQLEGEYLTTKKKMEEAAYSFLVSGEAAQLAAVQEKLSDLKVTYIESVKKVHQGANPFVSGNN